MLNLSKTESEAPVRGATREESEAKFIVRNGSVFKATSPLENRKDLLKLWWEFKRQEELAMTQRREIEEMLTSHLPEQWEGSETEREGEFKVVISRRFTRKVDSDALQATAREFGLEEYLPELFRWKPEIDAKRWKAAPAEVTAKLERAITVTPGKASVKITLEEE